MAIVKRVYTKTQKILLYGAGSLASLIFLLSGLGYYGIDIKTTGDIACIGNTTSPCVSYFNITTRNYSLQFATTLGVVYTEPSGVKTNVFIKHNNSRGLSYCGASTARRNWTLLDNGFYYCDSPTAVGRAEAQYQNCTSLTSSKLGCRLQQGEVWLPYNFTGKSIASGRTAEFMVVGYKPRGARVKWGVIAGGVNIDPVWDGVPLQLTEDPNVTVTHKIVPAWYEIFNETGDDTFVRHLNSTGLTRYLDFTFTPYNATAWNISAQANMTAWNYAKNCRANPNPTCVSKISNETGLSAAQLAAVDLTKFKTIAKSSGLSFSKAEFSMASGSFSAIINLPAVWQNDLKFGFSDGVTNTTYWTTSSQCALNSSATFSNDLIYSSCDVAIDNNSFVNFTNITFWFNQTADNQRSFTINPGSSLWMNNSDFNYTVVENNTAYSWNFYSKGNFTSYNGDTQPYPGTKRIYMRFSNSSHSEFYNWNKANADNRNEMFINESSTMVINNSLFQRFEANIKGGNIIVNHFTIGARTTPGTILYGGNGLNLTYGTGTVTINDGVKYYAYGGGILNDSGAYYGLDVYNGEYNFSFPVGASGTYKYFHNTTANILTASPYLSGDNSPGQNSTWYLSPNLNLSRFRVGGGNFEISHVYANNTTFVDSEPEKTLLNGTAWFQTLAFWRGSLNWSFPVYVNDTDGNWKSGVNITITSNETGAVVSSNLTDANGYAVLSYFWGSSPGSYAANASRFNVSIDGVYNETRWYNTDMRQGLRYTVAAAGGDTPTIIRDSQNPEDFLSDNLFLSLGAGFNITYNITSPGGVINATLWLKSNNSVITCGEYLNGTSSECGFEQVALFSNTSNQFTFSEESDDTIYPHTENLEDSWFYDTTHSAFSMSSINSQIKVELLNVSNATKLNIIEAMINTSSPTPTALEMYYCNSTYTTGRVDLSSYCALANSKILTDYNHTVNYSAMQLIAFTINTTAGTIAGSSVKVTPSSFFVFKPIVSISGYNAYYISNISRTSASQTTGNRGVTWSDLAGTFDVHLHQYSNETKVYYYACANDSVSGNGNCSTIYNESLDINPRPPSPVTILSPIELNYSGNILINYTASESPTGQTISFYNISLHNSDHTFNKTIQSNNSLNLTYLWDSIGTADGLYAVGVEACDNLDLCKMTHSQIFQIDNTPPTVTILSPTNTTYYQNWVNLTTTIADTGIGLNTTECYYSLDGFLNNASFNCTYINVTGFVTGAHTINITARDLLNQYNSTIGISFTLQELNINYADPTPADLAAFNVSQSAYINFTVNNSTAIDTFKIGWNGTNYTVWDDSLLLSWHLNDNETVSDESKYNRAGTVFNSTWTPGKFSGGYYLPGDIPAYVNSSNATYLGGNLTAMMWIKRGNWNCDANNNWRSLIRASTSTSQATSGFDVVAEENGNYQFDIGNGTNTSRLNGVVTTQDVWTFLSFIYNSSNGRQEQYVNGILSVNRTSGFGAMPIAAHPSLSQIIIGKGTNTGCPNQNGYLNGTVDEVKVWNRTLTADEIAFYYNKEVGKYWLNSTNMTAGTYTYFGWVNDSLGQSAVTATRSFAVSSVDLNVTLGAGISDVRINATIDPDNTVFPFTAEFTNQTQTIGLFVAQNNGTMAGQVQMKVNATNTNITQECAPNYFASGLINLTTAYQNIGGSINAGANTTIWCRNWYTGVSITTNLYNIIFQIV